MAGRSMDEMVQDRAYDEAIPVETDDEEVSTPGTSDAGSPAGAAKAPGQPLPGGPVEQKPGGDGESGGGSDSESSSSESSSSSGSGGSANAKATAAAAPTGAYNPDEFKNLKVSADIEELFGHITRYKPHTIELETQLKPFVPEFVPSIGEVDAFLKMPRPDGQASGLGTLCLDEPALNPSNPSILELQLRSLSKNQDLQPMEVRSIPDAEKKPQEVENWIRRIEDLNRSKPPPTVQYSRRMPDIEQLMQVWMSEFEEYLGSNSLPDLADLDLELKDYIRVIAAILDVPVQGQVTESLHVIFTLYSEFKSNQHFSKTDNMNDPYNFSNVASFAHGPGGGTGGGGGGAVFGGPPTESMAPSRAPSPIGQGNGVSVGGGPK